MYFKKEIISKKQQARSLIWLVIMFLAVVLLIIYLNKV